MKMKVRFWAMMFFVMVLVVPSMGFADVTFRMDMDANTAGLQTDIIADPGQFYTSNIEVFMDDANDSLSSFGFSLWWDNTELNIQEGDVTTSPLASGWGDLSYWKIESSYVYNFTQTNVGYSAGPITSVVATVNWQALNPSNDSNQDITLGMYDLFDDVYDRNGTQITPQFQGGTVAVAPEPVSSVLFLTGGAALGLNRFRRKRK